MSSDPIIQALDDACTDWQISTSTGNPDLVHEKAKKLLKAIKAVTTRKTVTLPETWPVSHNAMGVNEWNEDVARFVNIVAENPNFWHCNHAVKYLNVRIDTRDGAFLLLSDSGDSKKAERISPDIVLKTIREHKKLY